MKTLTTKAVTMTTANAIARQWLKAGLIFDSYNQAVGFALRKVKSIKDGTELVFPWEAKVECVAEIVKNLITTFVISNAKTVKTVNGDADNFNSTQAFIDTFGIPPKNFLEKGNIGRKTKLGFYWELTKELVVADKILVITKGLCNFYYYV